MSQRHAVFWHLLTHGSTETEAVKSHKTLQVWGGACWERSHSLSHGNTLWSHQKWINTAKGCNYLNPSINTAVLFCGSVKLSLFLSFLLLKTIFTFWANFEQDTTSIKNNFINQGLSVIRNIKLCHHGWGVFLVEGGYHCGKRLEGWEDWEGWLEPFRVPLAWVDWASFNAAASFLFTSQSHQS